MVLIGVKVWLLVHVQSESNEDDAERCARLQVGVACRSLADGREGE